MHPASSYLYWMLTFLRKIRRSFIESGSIRKYILYALGEILLVMIGILLALQVNTWNNNRINRNLEKQYLNRMIQDLGADLEEVERATLSSYRRILLGANVLDTLGVENFNPSDIYQLALQHHENGDFEIPSTFGEKLVQLRTYRVFNGTDITMQELLSNGKLDVIRDEHLRIAVQDHYSKIRINKFFTNLVIKARNDYLDEMTNLGISVTSHEKYHQVRRKIINTERLVAHIGNIVSLAGGLIYDYEKGENSIKKRTNDLIQEIESYLESLD